MIWVFLIIAAFVILAFSKPGYTSQYTIQSSKKIIKDLQIEIGDEVVLWSNQKRDIHVFAKGTAGSAGRIGIFQSNKIYNALENIEVTAKIIDIQTKSIIIEISLIK